MKPEQYRAMMRRAFMAGDEEVLGAMCSVLAENEAAKSILFQKGYGPASAGIDELVCFVPERIGAV